jgi:large subunit ribosomal protein L21
MFAIIETGGKQYKVQKDKKYRFEKITGKAGDKVDFKNVLLIGDDSKISIGKPFITNAKVTGELVRHFRGKKILVFKKKRRKNYRKTYGHRQPVSELKIVNITLDGTKISTTKSKSLQKKTEITSKKVEAKKTSTSSKKSATKKSTKKQKTKVLKKKSSNKKSKGK